MVSSRRGAGPGAREHEAIGGYRCRVDWLRGHRQPSDPELPAGSRIESECRSIGVAIDGSIRCGEAVRPPVKSSRTASPRAGGRSRCPARRRSKPSFARRLVLRRRPGERSRRPRTCPGPGCETASRDGGIRGRLIDRGRGTRSVDTVWVDRRRRRAGPRARAGDSDLDAPYAAPAARSTAGTSWAR